MDVALDEHGIEPERPRVSSLCPVAEALMAAATSDRPATHEEHEAIRNALCRLLDVDHLPLRLEERIAAFEPETFDLRALAQELMDSPVVGRRTLIELTRTVCDSDGVL